ncbi:MAG: sodium-dependent transporter [Calditrichaeota bacterium]|nr:sodium-dependent transporter [Calditrichota bacterium]MCB0288943.1 sodium-dependent transporter [Calditrichota bacterium]MCB0305763.1 sodium-dependent transporter [Calditrichota bacterium]
MSASRGEFGSKLGFVLAAAGSAVGLGNIWKFPYEVGNGGGAAFVVIYLLFCFLLCFPVMVAEIAIGRKTNRNPVGAFTAIGFKKWSNVGKLGLLSGVLILSFYNVVAGWAFGYFWEMIQGNFAIANNFGGFVSDWFKTGIYALLFMGATAFIVSGGVQDGIEKAAKILMPSLLTIILFLVIYSLTLPNASKGLEFYLVPNFSAITPKVVYGALGQAFFSLSLGMGALITYGSYVSRKENIITSAAMITLTDVGIAFIAGLMIFPFVFSQGIAPSQGPGLVFVTLPGIFQSLGPNLGILIGALFFLLLSFAALTSTVSLLEVPVSYLVDEHTMPRKKAVWLTAGFIFLVGIPSLLSNGASDFFSRFTAYFGAENPIDFMTLIGYIANDTFLPLGGFLIAVFAAYIWKKENLDKEIAVGYPGYPGSLVQKFMDLMISYLAPIVLGIVVVVTILNRFLGISILGLQ